MEIDERLLERSRDCVICYRVVSEIHAGRSTEDALLCGLLAASEMAETVKTALQMGISARAEAPRIHVNLNHEALRKVYDVCPRCFGDGLDGRGGPCPRCSGDAQ